MTDYLSLELRIEERKDILSDFKKFLQCFEKPLIREICIYGPEDHEIPIKKYSKEDFKEEYFSLKEVNSVLSEQKDWTFVKLYGPF